MTQRRISFTLTAWLAAAACAETPSEPLGPPDDVPWAASAHGSPTVVTMFMADFTVRHNGVPTPLGSDGMRVDIELDPAARDGWGPSDFGLFDVVEIRVTVPELGIADELVTNHVRYFEDDHTYERAGLSPPFPSGGIQIGRSVPRGPDQTIGDPNRIDDLPDYEGEAARSVWVNVTLVLANGDVLAGPAAGTPAEPFGTSCIGPDGLPPCAVRDADGDGVPDDEDPFPESDTSPTVVVGGDDTGVANLVVAPGTFFADLIGQCAGEAGNHGAFVRCVTHLAQGWRKAGLIQGKEAGRITSAAAGADLP